MPSGDPFPHCMEWGGGWEWELRVHYCGERVVVREGIAAPPRPASASRPRPFMNDPN
jgi:hypothetical protein